MNAQFSHLYNFLFTILWHLSDNLNIFKHFWKIFWTPFFGRLKCHKNLANLFSVSIFPPKTQPFKKTAHPIKNQFKCLKNLLDFNLSQSRKLYMRKKVRNKFAINFLYRASSFFARSLSGQLIAILPINKL